MNIKGGVMIAAGTAIMSVFALVMGLVILGGGAGLASAAGGLRGGTVPAQYEQWVRKAGNLCPETVGPAVIAAQIDAESGWNPNAVSPVGAQGLSQFMPGTWSGWGRDDNGNGRASPFDPADAIMAQGRYMCHLADLVRGYIDDGRAQGSVLDLALAAYNAGPGNVLAVGGIPHNGETEVYVARIRELMSKYSAPLNGGGAAGSALGASIVAAGTSQIGLPYVWGGGDHHGPTGGGFDCSGLVMYALYQGSGGQIALSTHLADWQARQGAPVTGPAPGSQIDLSLLRPGDVIGFADPGVNRFHHIGIYAGSGQLVHAPTFGQTVKVSSLDTSYWSQQIWQVRRFG